ncbi:MAG: 1-deoxy-D-xylulose-5-phosphate reductoisomerase [Salibacteraceae bacterium]
MKTTEKRHIAILGCTESIGIQALEVIEEQSNTLAVELLTANTNYELLIEQALKFKPNAVVIADKSYFKTVQDVLWPNDIKVFAGEEAIVQAVEMENINLVLTALGGYSGLKSTLAAIEAKKAVALANKETLAVAGELVTRLAAKNGVPVFPIDMEHSAIFQCLAGEFQNPIEKVILTASGGPFRGKDRAFLASTTKTHALKHANRSTAKVTVDSASLMNKGLEVIEAKWLFNLKPEQVDVIVHPQSIIHSMVQFEDGSMKAQMGLSNLKLPIQYALGYPNRLKNNFPRFDFINYPNLTFEAPDTDTFRNLTLAFESLNKGGNTPCVLNAANEIAVDAFLKDQIGFLEMSDLIETCLQKVHFVAQPDYDDYVQTDQASRQLARDFL